MNAVEQAKALVDAFQETHPGKRIAITSQGGLKLVPTEPLTCATCDHWHPAEREVQSLPPTVSEIIAVEAARAVDLSVPRTGQCREQPHLLTIQVPIRGGLKIEQQAVYLITPEGFPGCSRHVRREG